MDTYNLDIVNNIDDLKSTIKSWRLAGDIVALVPTMGNLHAGHLKLIEVAKQRSQRVVVSIFVNPSQFGPNEDLDAYPRTKAEDCLKLQQLAVDLLFLPSVETIYPQGSMTLIEVQGLSDQLCGQSRPGHFAGVATIVAKLFNIVNPDISFFGEKDFQQLVVIRAMVRDLNIPVEIAGVPTVRAPDGLALSSRNGYLTDEMRKVAPLLFKSLQACCSAIKSGGQTFKEIINQQLSFLQKQGFEPEYLAICRSTDLKPATAKDTQLVILVAARLGKTRLIDNLSFTK